MTMTIPIVLFLSIILLTIVALVAVHNKTQQVEELKASIRLERNLNTDHALRAEKRSAEVMNNLERRLRVTREQTRNRISRVERKAKHAVSRSRQVARLIYDAFFLARFRQMLGKAPADVIPVYKGDTSVGTHGMFMVSHDLKYPSAEDLVALTPCSVRDLWSVSGGYRGIGASPPRAVPTILGNVESAINVLEQDMERVKDVPEDQRRVIVSRLALRWLEREVQREVRAPVRIRRVGRGYAVSIGRPKQPEGHFHTPIALTDEQAKAVRSAHSILTELFSWAWAAGNGQPVFVIGHEFRDFLAVGYSEAFAALVAACRPHVTPEPQVSAEPQTVEPSGDLTVNT